MKYSWLNLFLDKIKKNKLLQDSFWAVFGNILSKGLSLLSGVLVARFLGSEVFGQFGIVKNTLMTSAIFATFGLGYTATKYVAENKNKNTEYLRLILNYSQLITFVFSLFFAVFIFLFSNYFAKHILDEISLSIPLKIASIYIVFNAVNTTQIGIISGYGGFKKMTKINLYVGVFTFIITSILSYLFDLYGALTALILSQIFNWFLNYRLINQYKKRLNIKRSSSSFSREVFREILVFSLPIALQEAIYSFSSWGVSIVLVTYSSFSEVGVYGAAMQWNVIILFVPAILRNVVLSHFSENSQNENEKNKILKRVVFFNFVITFIPYLLIVVFSGFISTFYGETFYEMTNVLPILVLSSVFLSMSNVYTQAYLSASRNWEMMFLRIFRDLGILVACYLMVSNNFKNLSPSILVALGIVTFNFLFFLLMGFNYHNKIFIKWK